MTFWGNFSFLVRCSFRHDNFSLFEKLLRGILNFFHRKSLFCLKISSTFSLLFSFPQGRKNHSSHVTLRILAKKAIIQAFLKLFCMPKQHAIYCFLSPKSQISPREQQYCLCDPKNYVHWKRIIIVHWK